MGEVENYRRYMKYNMNNPECTNHLVGAWRVPNLTRPDMCKRRLIQCVDDLTRSFSWSRKGCHSTVFPIIGKDWAREKTPDRRILQEARKRPELDSTNYHSFPSWHNVDMERVCFLRLAYDI